MWIEREDRNIYEKCIVPKDTKKWTYYIDEDGRINAELRTMFSALDIIRLLKSKRISWAGHMSRERRANINMRNYTIKQWTKKAKLEHGQDKGEMIESGFTQSLI